ncbi:biofilm regulation protein phosphatase SiaA [Telmatospirillum sp.]|uniref:biofilm regulation protein phosphatase SiaA n=1 Tax=Telmatospirillum sp. TaxID=2079197 RepID=UPI00285025B3|nr:biofilm regulation protein phosphatase SiaA [Telmatospirillum sp.]MDR3439422.1 biofilm regulation protein phosphatase SiaA [Telmatospirillum sp.]
MVAPHGEPPTEAASRRLGLRGKSLVALLLSCLVALLPATVMGWQAIKGVRENFGLAYAKNLNELSRQKILAPVSRELALSLRMADSEVTRQWILDEKSAAKRQLFFAEAEGYRRAFRDHSWFLVVDDSRNHYFRDDHTAGDVPIETLDPAEKKDAWYFATMRNTDSFSINVDTDVAIDETKVWFNVIVKDGDKKIGMTGTGLDLSSFLRDFIVNDAAGVTPMIIDRKGNIQAHHDKRLIVLNSASGAEAAQPTVFNLLTDDTSRRALQETVAAAEQDPTHPQTAWIILDDKRQLAAVSYIPELRWLVLTVVDLNAAHFIDTGWIVPAAIAVALLLLLLLFGFGYAVETLVLQPLRRLQQSAHAIAGGRYDVALPEPRNDEIGELSRSFGIMVDRVRHHTEDLEQKVRERTAALETSHRQIADAHKKLGDSIDYASLIQRAILPDRQMLQSLGPHHFVFWMPRDVVGGDFYVFHEDGENCLLGIVDCAGHGVPGALMTMLARAAIDHALREIGPTSPAGVLTRTDTAMRDMIEDSQLPHAIATNMDAGLVYIDKKRRRLLFSGAKISLYWSDGTEVQEIKGGRRAIGDRKVGQYTDQDIELRPERTYYLTTDGFLDQAGGEHGYGFGKGRFADMLRRNAGLGLTEQSEAIAQTLAHYQGERPQRDDITVLSFRFD